MVVGMEWMLVTEMMGWMMEWLDAHSRRGKPLRYVMLPLQGIDNPEGV
jgi:hypothetical protein